MQNSSGGGDPDVPAPQEALKRGAAGSDSGWNVINLLLVLEERLLVLYCNCVCVCVSTASSVDFLMSDGEDEGSFLSLPAAAFSQRPSLTAELNNTNSSHHQLLIQVKTLQQEALFCLRQANHD